MKNFVSIAIVGIFVLSGLGAAALTPTIPTASPLVAKNQSTSVVFSSPPSFQEKDGYATVELAGRTTQLLISQKPIVPLYVQTFELPFGSQNIQVTCTAKNIGTIVLTKQLIPACVAPLSILGSTPTVKDESVYESTAYFPGCWYTVDVGAGRNADFVETTYVKVVCYPVQYSPGNNQVNYAAGFDISLNYNAPKNPQKTTDVYDMVVIAPKEFKAPLQKLVNEKNTKGVKTIFKSVEDIYSEYTGADPPEQVKMFIKYAYDTWNIKYALLVGGLKSHLKAKDKDTTSYGSTAWHVPVRYMNIPEVDLGATDRCISDLYYGCLYNATGAFDSWDSNHDGIYGAYEAGLNIPNDKFDLIPEVFVGRLPCTSISEVRTVVSKILKYESSGPDAKPWYSTFIGVGGKTSAYYKGQPDGEYMGDLAMSYMKNVIPNLNPVKCYSTNRDTGGLTPVPKDIVKSISAGAGFVDFEGHGNPFSWNTIWFDGVYPKDWAGGVYEYLFPFIKNDDKLPVVIVGGCHNGLFNVSILGTLLDRNGTAYFTYGYPIPVCFSWGLVVKPHGGAIASTGCTGFGFGGSGNPVTFSGELEMNFFWQIGNNTIQNLGAAHSLSITKYVNENYVDKIGSFCITNWQLFGDPSLQFGGYAS